MPSDFERGAKKISATAVKTTGCRVRKQFAGAAFVLLLLYAASSAWFTWSMTRRQHSQQIQSIPAQDAERIESFRLTTRDHQQIGAWLFRGEEGSDCVLLLHGNGETRRSMLPLAKRLHRSGQTVLLITFRGHGDSGGDRNDFGYSGKEDVLAAVRYLEKHFSGSQIFIVGRSLGAAAAIFAAKDLGDRIAGYLLESPYNDLPTAVWHRLRVRLPFPLDYVAYSGARLWAPFFLGVDPSRIAPYSQIGFIPASSRVILLYGEEDLRAPLREGNRLANQVQGDVSVVTFPGASHRRLYDWDSKRYAAAVSELLGQPLAP